MAREASRYPFYIVAFILYARNLFPATVDRERQSHFNIILCMAYDLGWQDHLPIVTGKNTGICMPTVR